MLKFFLSKGEPWVVKWIWRFEKPWTICRARPSLSLGMAGHMLFFASLIFIRYHLMTLTEQFFQHYRKVISRPWSAFESAEIIRRELKKQQRSGDQK